MVYLPQRYLYRREIGYKYGVTTFGVNVSLELLMSLIIVLLVGLCIDLFCPKDTCTNCSSFGCIPFFDIVLYRVFSGINKTKCFILHMMFRGKSIISYIL